MTERRLRNPPPLCLSPLSEQTFIRSRGKNEVIPVYVYVRQRLNVRNGGLSDGGGWKSRSPISYKFESSSATGSGAGADSGAGSGAGSGVIVLRATVLQITGLI